MSDDTTRWEGYDHAEILAMLADTPAGSASQYAEGRWHATWFTIQSIEANLSRAITESGSGWEGEAAIAMAAGVTPLGVWGLAAADRALSVSKTLAGQAGYADYTRDRMPPISDPGLGADPPSGMGVTGGLLEDWQAADQRRHDDATEARRLMAVYTANSFHSLPGVLGSEAPPVVVVDGGTATSGSGGGTVPVGGGLGAVPVVPAGAPGATTGLPDPAAAGGASTGGPSGGGTGSTALGKLGSPPAPGGGTGSGFPPIAASPLGRDPATADVLAGSRTSTTGSVPGGGRDRGAGAPAPGGAASLGGGPGGVGGYGGVPAWGGGTDITGRGSSGRPSYDGRIRPGTDPFPPPARLDRGSPERPFPSSTPSTGDPTRPGRPGSGSPGVMPMGAGGGGDNGRTHRRPGYLVEDADVFTDHRWVTPHIINAPESEDDRG